MFFNRFHVVDQSNKENQPMYGPGAAHTYSGEEPDYDNLHSDSDDEIHYRDDDESMLCYLLQLNLSFETTLLVPPNGGLREEIVSERAVPHGRFLLYFSLVDPRGGPPPPHKWDIILSYLHTFSPKSARIGCLRPPPPPPTENPGSATASVATCCAFQKALKFKEE